MRKVLLALALPVVMTAGCCTCDNGVSTGWSFQVLRPPVVKTESQMLVGSANTMAASGLPVGGFAGPITAAQMQTSAPPPPVAAAAPCTPPASALPMPQREPEAKKMTCEEWCEMMRQVQRQQLPKREE